MTKNTTTVHFPSLSSAAHFAETAPRKWKTNASAELGHSKSWDLGADLPQALKLAYNGWNDGAKAIAQGLELLPARHSIPSKRYGVYGHRVNVGKFASGNPVCMVQKRSTERPKPGITIAVQIGANAGVSAEHMSNYGLALAAYIERLSLMGYPVEVIAVDVYSYSAGRLVVSWTVKQMGAPLNYSDIAFSIGHPAAMRRLSFAIAERSDFTSHGGTYGGAGNAVPSDYPHKSNVIILNGMLTANQHSKTPELAMEHVSKAIGEALTALDLETAH